MTDYLKYPHKRPQAPTHAMAVSHEEPPISIEEMREEYNELRERMNELFNQLIKAQHESTR